MTITSQQFIITEEQQNIRLDKFLSDQIKSLSRSIIQSLIADGKVQVNGLNVPKKYILSMGDIVTISFAFKNNIDSSIKARSDIKLDIIYEDKDIIVLNKAAGLTVHPGAGNHNNTLVNALIHYSKGELSAVRGSARPGIVHRIDKDTSGALIVAKNDIAHMKLCKDLEEKKIERRYIALVYGFMTPPIGKIESTIGKSHRDHTKMCVYRDNSKGKRAVTNYRVLKLYYDGLLSLLECKLETGRTHQIRVHMSHLGHPIIGDQLYGKHINISSNKIEDDLLMKKISNLRRQFLHAQYIAFEHPITREKMSFEVPISKDLQSILDLLESCIR